jgi:O-antigen/teichoic acid export membrane protein
MLNSEETLAQKFVKKWFWLYLFTLLIGPIGYLIKILISEDLGPGGIGLIYGVISFVTLLGAFNDLGCTESLNYFLPKYIIKNEYAKAKYLLKLTLILQICSSLLIATVLFFIAPWFATTYFHESHIIEILRIAGLYFIGINLFHITTVLFSVSQDTKLQKGSDFLKMLSIGIGTLLLWTVDRGSIEYYMWAWVWGTLIGCIFSLYFSYTRYYTRYFAGVRSEKNITDRNHFIRYALATLMTANIGVILSQVDMQLIIVLLDPLATGYYSNYLSLLNIPFIFISPLFAFLFPVISELHGREDRVKMQHIHREFSLYFSILGIWLSLFLYQFGESLAVLFFGTDFRESGIILWYSAFFLTFLLLIQINFQFLAGTGKIGARARILAIVLPINIVLNYVFIRLYGVAGSALAVGLSWIPLWYLSYRATHIHNSGFDWIPFIRNMVFVTISGSISWYIIYSIWLQSTSRIESFVILGIAMIVNLTIFILGNRSLLKNAWWIIRKNK